MFSFGRLGAFRSRVRLWLLRLCIGQECKKQRTWQAFFPSTSSLPFSLFFWPHTLRIHLLPMPLWNILSRICIFLRWDVVGMLMTQQMEVMFFFCVCACVRMLRHKMLGEWLKRIHSSWVNFCRKNLLPLHFNKFKGSAES